MITAPRPTARVVAVLAAASVGLAGCGVRSRVPPAEGITYGVYAGTYEAPESREVRFRVWLFAEAPDRIHAEVVGPAGGTHLVVDGGGDRLAVTLIGEATCFAGSASPEGVRAALGVRASLEQIVSAFLGGSLPDDPDLRFGREPSARPGLPDRFEVSSEGRRLTLEKRGTRRGSGAPAKLGTGEPPPGIAVRPLDDLGAVPWGRQ